jgi:hypothetical protein
MVPLRVLVVTLLFASTVNAQSLSVARPAPFVGRNEISAQIGFQAGLGGSTPGGLKLFFDYSRHMRGIVWWNIKVNPTFGTGSAGTICYDSFGYTYVCGPGFGGNGHAIDFLSGVKLKIPATRVPLVGYVNLAGGLVALIGRPYPDDGVAVVFRPGGGFKYFVTPHIGVGAELSIGIGPAFHSATCTTCNNSRTDVYGTFELATGAEFIL